MYLQDALGSIFRRWYVVLAGLALMVYFSSSALHDVKPDYQANGQLVLLLPSSATGADNPTSPYLNVPSGLTTAAAIVSGQVATDDAVAAVVADGFTATYSVSVLPGAGPIVAVTAKGTDPAEVLETRDEVMERVDRQLATIQDAAAVPDNQRIYTEVVSADRIAERLHGSRLRALVGVFGSGSLVLLLVVAAVDRSALWVGRTRRRRRSESLAGLGPVEREPDRGPLVGAAAPRP